MLPHTLITVARGRNIFSKTDNKMKCRKMQHFENRFIISNKFTGPSKPSVRFSFTAQKSMVPNDLVLISSSSSDLRWLGLALNPKATQNANSHTCYDQASRWKISTRIISSNLHNVCLPLFSGSKRLDIS